MKCLCIDNVDESPRLSKCAHHSYDELQPNVGLLDRPPSEKGSKWSPARKNIVSKGGKMHKSRATWCSKRDRADRLGRQRAMVVVSEQVRWRPVFPLHSRRASPRKPFLQPSAATATRRIYRRLYLPKSSEWRAFLTSDLHTRLSNMTSERNDIDIVLAFDIYGTILDTSKIADAVSDFAGVDKDTAKTISASWR